MPNHNNSTGSIYGRTRLQTARYFLLLWSLFFLVCLGLGYPTLKRYDPRATRGLSDTIKYYAMTTGEDQSSFRDVFRRRVLVPTVARPFYWFALRLPGTWDPGFFGLLVANSIFCAATACLVVSIGTKLLNDLSVSLLGATLYLLSFAVPQLLLVGLVDAGEACFMALLIWALQNGRWFLLPVLGIFGAMAKETFVPFSTVFAFTWWFIEGRRVDRIDGRGRRLILIVAMAILGLGTVMLVHSQVMGFFAWPWEMARTARADANYLKAIVRAFTQPNFWYVFGWLLPLGIWRLGSFPRKWVAATATAAVTAILLGAFIDAGGSIGRSVFNISGGLLSLSVALLISRPTNDAAFRSTP
ncbi:MAG TPA: hypothetical protein VNO50_08400 [Pyrinomonadaceae bacterium]|nr:hypothetical protein [Pyrinomonadaceae bacterium]